MSVVDAAVVEVLPGAESDLRALDGADVLVTGSSGFVGAACVAAVLAAREALGVRVRLTLVCRRPERLARELCEAPGVRVVATDLGRERLALRADLAVHAAFAPGTAPAVAAAATRDVLAAAPRVVVTSSGAVYGTVRAPVAEDQPLDGGTDYALAKIASERVAVAGGAVIGRLFAFCGRGLPADGRFALADFLLDRLAGRPVLVRSDGTAVRSYLDVADLTVALFALLVRGRTGEAYNVGAPEPISIRQLADVVATVELGLPCPSVAVRTEPGGGAGNQPSYYVPDTTRLTRLLDTRQRVPFEEGLRRTAEDLQARQLAGSMPERR